MIAYVLSKQWRYELVLAEEKKKNTIGRRRKKLIDRKIKKLKEGIKLCQ